MDGDVLTAEDRLALVEFTQNMMHWPTPERRNALRVLAIKDRLAAQLAEARRFQADVTYVAREADAVGFGLGWNAALDAVEAEWNRLDRDEDLRMTNLVAALRSRHPRAVLAEGERDG